MNARRFFKLLATRWWLIVIVALAGSATAFQVAEWSNRQIEETWEANAPVLILRTNSENEGTYEARLRGIEATARVGLAPLLTDSETYQMESNVNLGRLVFIARAPTRADAIQRAEDLRAAYEESGPSGDIADDLRAQLNDAALQIASLRDERSRLTAGTPIDPGVAAELSLMESQLSSLRQRAAALSLGVRFAELGTALDDEGIPRPVEEVQQELDAVRSVTARLQGQYDRLRAANPTAQPPEEGDNLDLLVLDQKIRQAEALYIETSLDLEELLGGNAPNVFSTETGVRNATEIPTSQTRAGLIGLVLGAALALSVLVGTDRLRRPVLGIEDDLALPVRATVSPARRGSDPAAPWYTDGAGRRRSDIQVLRAALDGAMTTGAVSIGLSGLGTNETAVQELAADLAVSIAASDHKVLLVDAAFGSPSQLPEFGSEGPSLADIVTYSATPDEARGDLKLLLVDRDEVVPQLTAIHAGEFTTDPVDMVASRRFRDLLQVARDVVEITIVAAPRWGDPATDMLTQRVDFLVLVGRTNKTTAPAVEEAAAELAGRTASAAGLVLLRRRSLLGRLGERRLLRDRLATGVPDAPDDPELMASDFESPTESDTGDVAPEQPASRRTLWDSLRHRYDAFREQRRIRQESPAPEEGPSSDEMGPTNSIALAAATLTAPGAEDDVAVDEPPQDLDSDSFDPNQAGAELLMPSAADLVENEPPPEPESVLVEHHDESDSLVETPTVDSEPDSISPPADPAPAAEFSDELGVRPTELDAPDFAEGPAPGVLAEEQPIDPPGTRDHSESATGEPLVSVPHATEDGDSRDDDSLGERYPTDDVKPGEVFLMNRLAELVAHGLEGPHRRGHPYGALLMSPDRIEESAAAILYSAVFEEASRRPGNLEHSLRRAIGIEGMRADVVSSIEWWFRVVDVEPKSATRDDVLSALFWWLRRRAASVQDRILDEPAVWYLSSRLGTFQALVHAPTFDSSRALSLRAAAVLGLLEQLRLEHWSSGRFNSDGNTSLEAQVKDVEDFGIALDRLSRNPAGIILSRQQLEEAGVLAPGHQEAR